VDGEPRGGATAEEPSFRVRGPLLGQGAAAERILRALPGWFGIESALLEYAHAAEEWPTLVAVLRGASCDRGERPGSNEVRPDRVIGFVTLKETSEDALELHVMGVLPAWHRRGAGRALLERAASYARAEGYSLLHVKTLASSQPDPGYVATRAFYAAAGFRPLEVLPEVWGPENPCLLMVRPL
jgi:ribosomal protein S18 acetylase RimI-like enzyme